MAIAAEIEEKFKAFAVVELGRRVPRERTQARFDRVPDCIAGNWHC